MPSHLHESLLRLFRNQPALAPELIRSVMRGHVPPFEEARVVAADFTDIQPAEYRADMVIELRDDKPVFAIILEVQLAKKKPKRFAWPAYVANLRARLKCPVCLLVVTADDAVARWAAKPIEMGGLHQLTPYVLGPSGVPELTDEKQARENPELAVLSAMAHGRDANIERALEIALMAHKVSVGLDADRSKVYVDLILDALGEAARQALKNMAAQEYVYQSDFARKYFADGRAKGRAEGRAEGKAKGLAKGEAEGRAALIRQQLRLRFGAIGSRAENRIKRASIAELERIGARLLEASSLQEALGAE